MVYYIIRRVLHLIPILLGVAFIFFFIFNVVGGQEKYLRSLLTSKVRTEEDLALYRQKYGLDKPLVIQYFDYIKQIVTMNFGRSASRSQKISTLLKRHVPTSAKLTFPAFFFEILISLTLAMLCAFYRGKAVDRTLTIISVIGMSMPMLVLIILGQTILAYRLKLFPIGGWEQGIRQIRYLVLPWILWVVVSIGYDIRFFRTALLEEVHKDYVRTARAKGLSERTIMLRHVLKNTMIPILTYVVIQIPFLLTGSLLLERFFSIPGIGDLLINSLQSYDLPVLKATIMIFTIFFVFFTLITDILYALVDPRVRLQ